MQRLHLGAHRNLTHQDLVGNYYNKYTTRNPVARCLMTHFLQAISTLYRQVGPETVLEVGCGEGLLIDYLIKQESPPRLVEACDVSLSEVSGQVSKAIIFREATIYDLPYEDGAFELVISCEVLEHLDTPSQALAELVRVARKAVLVSTPREPLWRVLNMVRGKYLAHWGNTPGHIQHYSVKGLIDLLTPYLNITEIKTPLPWSVVLGTPRQ